MMQNRIEGKWLAAFRRVFKLNGIRQGTRVLVVSETQSRPDHGLSEPGADFLC